MAFTALLAGSFAGAAAGPASAAPPDGSKIAMPSTWQAGRYIVQLAADPVVAYDGGVRGLAATAPATGEKVNPRSAAVRAYSSYLDATEDKVLDGVPGSVDKIHDYRYTFNGFAADLTAGQVAALRKSPNVVNVTKDELRQLDTTRTPEFLGLTGRRGVWNKLGGKSNAGAGTVVGIIDTGIWPESPSFAPLPGNPAPPAGWTGECETGEEFTLDDCSSKIIGARYFVEGFGVENLDEEEYVSPRDGDGHGSHTGSTAAGNNGVPVSEEGIDFGRASGMAPAAQIAAYKVCWNGAEGDGCATSDSVKAIDTAVEDGVDVLNYSISGSQTSFLDPVEVAFLFAADAGVFVAASAGNGGPGPSTVAHNSPWLTTVAAGTHDREGRGSVTLGNGETYRGASITEGTDGAKPLVTSTEVANATADPDEARLCFIGTLDPAKASGKIVICDRGSIARADKSIAVREADGAGMILANTSPSSLNADLHVVPSVHVDEVAGQEIKDYQANTANPTANIADARIVFNVPAPEVAEFSSRGPALAGEGDLLKPDIMAPGVDVLAAVAPPFNQGRDYDFYSGTSMSSPHIAGIGALMRQAHPDWSPMMIKSALMTGANRYKNRGGKIEGSPFDYGSGQVRPRAALNPGLTYDAGFEDWIQFLCGTGQLSEQSGICQDFGSIDPSDLNYATVAIGSLAGKQTVTRTVTSTADSRQTYRAAIVQPDGVKVNVQPRRFSIEPGADKKVRIKFTSRDNAELDEYTFGRVIFKSEEKRTRNAVRFKVRTELAVQPVAIAAPEEVRGEGTSGSLTYDITAGYTGQLGTSVAGLVPAEEFTGQTLTESSGGFDGSAPDEDTALYEVTVPAGTALARFSLFDRDYAADTDLDIFVFTATGSLVGVSAGGTSEEEVELNNPEPGTYLVAVDAFAFLTDTVTPRLFAWSLGNDPAGNMTASSPGAVESGENYQITVEWDGLAPEMRYLGRVDYTDGGGDNVGNTIVRVDTDSG
ncbi:MAG: S8 family serine peptidase [Acidothermales bacterium]|nr:S8 family serine peptidase [Acidothermales bacterium]